MKRRQMLAISTAATLVPLASSLAWADNGPNTLSVLAAGPDGDLISRWADACALAMGPGFPGSPSVTTQAAGGLDGVTGGNRFDALVVPDGATAAMFPGATLISWLIGDSRVHFDPTHWTPIMAGTNSGVLVARLDPTVTPSPKALQMSGGLKIAVDQPESNDLAVLLALERMGVHTAPIFGLRDTGAKSRSFVAGESDAVFLCGEGVPEDIAPLMANGGLPVFSLGKMGDDGIVAVDPLFPALPDASSFGQVPATAPYAAAYQAAAAAARLDFLMVLPHLTDPNAVAMWQRAGQLATQSPALGSAADASSINLRGFAGAGAELTSLALSPDDQAALQNFLQTRFGWRAS
jgi:hypothetical protein